MAQPAEIEAAMENVINDAMYRLTYMGAENTKLVALSEVVDIETALRDYRDQLVEAFSRPVLFNHSYPFNLEENMKCYIDVSLSDIGLIDNVGYHHECMTTPTNLNNRGYQRSVRSFNRIHQVIKIVYDGVNSLKSLEYKLLSL